VIIRSRSGRMSMSVAEREQDQLQRSAVGCIAMVRPRLQELVQEIDIWLVGDTRLLHCRTQVIGSSKCLCLIEVGNRKEHDYFVRIVDTPQQVEFGKSG